MKVIPKVIRQASYTLEVSEREASLLSNLLACAESDDTQIDRDILEMWTAIDEAGVDGSIITRNADCIFLKGWRYNG